MSDYLSSLAARSLKLTGMIRPRLRSIFEPLDFTAISEEDCFIENTPSKPHAAKQSSHSLHPPKSPQYLSDRHLSDQHRPDQPKNLNAAKAMDYPTVVRLQLPTEKTETNDQKEAGCKDLSAIDRTGADRIEAMDFLNGNSEGSALRPLKTESIQSSHPNQMASSSQDHQMPPSSSEGANRNANEKLGPDGLADCRISPEKPSPQAHGQEIQDKATALTDEIAGDTVDEGITGVENPNTENWQNHHSIQISDASSLSLKSPIQAFSGASLREELSLKSDCCRGQNDHSQERPNLSYRDAQMPLDEERPQSAIQSHRDHSSLKAPDKENLKRTERKVSVPPVESAAISEKKLLQGPISPIDFFRAAKAFQGSNSKYGLPSKSTDGLFTSGSALSEAETHTVEMARPRDYLLPSDLSSREISSRDEPDSRILPGKIETVSPNPHLQDSQSLRTEVALSRDIEGKKSADLWPSLVREGLLPSGKIETTAESTPGEDTWPTDGRAESREPTRVGSNGIEPQEQMIWPEKTTQTINQIHQLPQSSKAAISQIGPIEGKNSAKLQISRAREGLLPSGKIEETTESTPGEDTWPTDGRAESREPTREGLNELEPEAQTLWPEKTTQTINQIHQLPQPSKAAISQIESIGEKNSAELRLSREREGLLPSGQTLTTARVRADENFDVQRANLSARIHSLHQPSSWTNDDQIQLEDLDDRIGLSLIKDLHSSSNRISSSESDGDDLFLPLSRRSAMTRTAQYILSSDQVMRSRMNQSPDRQQKNAYTIGGIVESLKRSERTEKQLHASQPHAYESAENIALSKKRHLPPPPVARKLREAFSEKKVEESRDEKTASSVKVTIGRIEVRAAITPEKPAEKARSKIQILSLDDYLRLRNGGQR